MATCDLRLSWLIGLIEEGNFGKSLMDGNRVGDRIAAKPQISLNWDQDLCEQVVTNSPTIRAAAASAASPPPTQFKPQRAQIGPNNACSRDKAQARSALQ